MKHFMGDGVNWYKIYDERRGMVLGRINKT
jgi:hypothetical protein